MYIVTGVSKGLGRAIVELLLQNGEHVIGVGRNSSIEHQNYFFQYCDLSNYQQVIDFKINVTKGSVTLINNAGVIGSIKRISDQKELDLREIMQVNTIAPMEITKMIYHQIQNKDSFTLVNISSGAANKAIPSWAGYCASKAALNMLTEAFYLEEKEKGNFPKILTVAPGVIDSDMQQQIRNTDKSDFSSVQNFINLKNNNELFSPIEAASRLLKLIEQEQSSNESIFFDLRNTQP